jgi:hypothetical protein
MAVVTASIGSEPRAGGPSVWRKFLDAVVEPQLRNAEHEIIEYLQRQGTICRPRYGLSSSVAAWAHKRGTLPPAEAALLTLSADRAAAISDMCQTNLSLAYPSPLGFNPISVLLQFPGCQARRQRSGTV